MRADRPILKSKVYLIKRELSVNRSQDIIREGITLFCRAQGFN